MGRKIVPILLPAIRQTSHERKELAMKITELADSAQETGDQRPARSTLAFQGKGSPLQQVQ